jgi:peptidoglycan-associated lipoprotein
MLGLMMSVSACSKKKTVVTEPDNGKVAPPTKVDKTGENGITRPPEPRVKSPEFDENVKTIYFDFDKSNVRADQTANLEGNANYLKEKADLKICIEGHCDERGTNEYNFALGERRAKSVLEFLISRGVAADRLSIVSKGEEEPADPGKNEAAYAKNRRAMFLVTQ